MQINDYSILNWSDKINANSRAVDLLGIWSQHLKIQIEFTRAITSVTRRIRYYTLIAYYFENLSNIIDDNKNYERIFILSCLAHHDGEFSDLYGVENKTRFKDDWSNKKNFDLDFKISGQGWSYYVKQLAILRSVWYEYGNIIKTPINKKLAFSLENVSTSFFRQKTFNKKELRELGEESFCICNSENNVNEIDIMSKLLFGFFSKIDGAWDIDEEEYQLFQEGTLNLEITSDAIYEDSEVIEMNLRRRNSLLLFLKIINETKPPITGFRRYLWDAIYFKQDRRNHDYINFGRLEMVRTYWEFLQLNIYYIYSIEMFLELINDIVNDNSIIAKNNLIKKLDRNSIFLQLEEILNREINHNMKLSEFIDIIDNLFEDNLSNLDILVNESIVFDEIKSSEQEKKLANIFIMLALVYRRYLAVNNKIKDFAFNDKRSGFYSLFIKDIIEFIKENQEMSIYGFLEYLCDLIIKRHLIESTLRLYDSNTRNWLFVEEEGLLYGEGRKIDIGSRDNRWGSIKSLLSDLNFISEIDGHIVTTEKGISWLKRIE